MLTQARVKELFHYDQIAGVVIRKQAKPPKGKIGDILKTTDKGGYVVASVDNKPYKVHRIIWLWMTGEWPDGFIDHQDGNVANNAWENLRVTDHQGNLRNTRRQKRNKTGCSGVWYDQTRNNFQVYIRFDGKRKHYGRYDTIEEATEVWLRAREECGYHPNHGRD